MNRFAALIFAAFLAACTPSAPSSTSPPKPAPVGQWLDADGPGETALVYRVQGAEDFVIACGTSKAFKVSAGAMPANDKAFVFFDSDTYRGDLKEEPGAPTRSTMSLPVSDALLASVRKAKSVRLTAGDHLAETGLDTNGKLAAFADNCAQLNKAAPAPATPPAKP